MGTFRVEMDGAQLVGERTGSGEAIVFLHAGVADRRMWRPQLAALGADHHVIAYDRRGFGETSAPDEPFAHVEDLRAVLDQLNIGSASLVGCSQGGRIAIDYALAYPQRVNALVLIASAISGAPAIEEIPAEIEAVVDALDEAEAANDLARVNAIEAHLWLDGPTSPEGRVSGELRDLFLDMNGIALAKPELTQRNEPPSAYERVNALSIPTLIIVGDLDFPHVRENCRYLAATIPGAHSAKIAGAAHLPNLEQPKLVNQLLHQFLALHDRPRVEGA